MDVALSQLATIFLNSINESYSCNIRNSRIKTFDNTGVLRDQFECIDLSDNLISSLGNISGLNKLKTFIACNNEIELIEPGFCKSLPNLESLILTNNRLKSIESISAIFLLKNLKRLSLVNNPITKIPHYKAIMIGMLPNLVYLDFQKINQFERNTSELFIESNYLRNDGIFQIYSPNLLKSSQINNIGEPSPIVAFEKSNGLQSKLTPVQLNNIKMAISFCNNIEKLKILEDSLINNEISPEAQEIMDDFIKK
ncbi:putative U2 small nuclear ribonucleoprotein A' LRR repeat-containing protein [Cryptosporidium canis]|uniref:U2 small nuclear ribonucleoprotein A' LRR repeat-containing protein n=1 Tax=Cryptosporidium canis TaxID=195482 RepID=A0A9D5HWV4_9CRYT|nr:putative U2 small nuclear ribonucleoprotein A' LRR repeat-containing protein [Cryptosporidium canis]